MCVEFTALSMKSHMRTPSVLLEFASALVALKSHHSKAQESKHYQGEEESHVQEVALIPGLLEGDGAQVEPPSTLHHVFHPQHQPLAWRVRVRPVYPTERLSRGFIPAGVQKIRSGR